MLDDYSNLSHLSTRGVMLQAGSGVSLRGLTQSTSWRYLSSCALVCSSCRASPLRA